MIQTLHIDLASNFCFIGSHRQHKCLFDKKRGMRSNTMVQIYMYARVSDVMTVCLPNFLKRTSHTSPSHPVLTTGMATFSPSPAPRLRVQNHGNSPIKRSHRLAATPSFTTNDANSTVSAMDVDERASTITDRSLSRIGGDILFAKTDEMSVLFYASLPLEVKQILRVSGTSATKNGSNFASFICIQTSKLIHILER